MGSLGGITGSSAAQLARQQAEGKSAQPRAAQAYLNPGSPEMLDDDVLISTVLDVGETAEAGPEHEEVGPHLSQNQPPPHQHSAAPFVTGYGVPQPAGSDRIDREGLGPAPVGETRKEHAATAGITKTRPASRLSGRWFLIILITLAAIEAVFVWTAGSGR